VNGLFGDAPGTANMESSFKVVVLAMVQNMMSSIFARYPFLAGSRVVAPRN
jgi:hypothetical protein